MTSLKLADGRSLEYMTTGPERGTPLLLHVGTPSAALLFEPMADAAHRHGLRFVTYSRPGYAGSTPQPGRTVASACADTAALLAHLGAEQFVTIGWSGGGPHALACAALLPGLCRATALMASVAPFDADGLDWFAGMGRQNIDDFTAVSVNPEQLAIRLDARRPTLAELRPDQVAASMDSLVSDVDRKAITDDTAEYFATIFRAAVSTGMDGWLHDYTAFVNDWGFALSDIRTPVAVWQGSEDGFVPFGHGRWLAEHIPYAEPHLVQGEGHMSLMNPSLDRMVGDLAAHVR